MGAQESKLSFRRGIFRLHEERNIALDDPYWHNFWTLPEGAEDVFTLFSPTDIRRARDEAPENFKSLLLVLCTRLFALKDHAQFPTSNESKAPEQHLLNCLRVLTRLIPFIFESDAMDDAMENFWWVKRTRRTSRSVEPPEESTPTQESIQMTQMQATSNAEEVEPMAEELMHTLVDLLFYSGFTIPPNQKGKVVYSIWETGVGCTIPMGSTKQLDSNRIEVLRCILALISRGMYIPANVERENRHITHLVVTTPKNVVLAILCSMLNITMKYNPTTWRTLPYSAAFLADSRQLLVTYCLQFLLALLCYPLPESGTTCYIQQSADKDEPVDQFRYYFKKLHRAADFNFMVDGMLRALQQPLQASTALLPGSQKAVRYYPEMLFLFWETLQQNRRFRTFLIETDRALDFLVLLLFYALENKTDPAQIGLVRMCVFILQPLSAESKFAKSLSKPFEGHNSLPASVRIPSPHCTYADYLVVSIYSLIATSRGALVSLYPALFMTLSNVAPYFNGLSIMASTKLLQLLNSIAQPSFLFANELNHQLLLYLLEVLNGIIEHNFSENPHLIYAILRNNKVFTALQKLSLDSGLEQIQRLRRRRAEKEKLKAVDEDAPLKDSFAIGDHDDSEPEASSPVARSRTHSRTPSMADDIDFTPSPKVMSEKAKGKLPEGRRESPPVLQRQNSASSIGSAQTLGLYQHAILDTGFLADAPWFQSWYPDLDLSPIMQVLTQLQPEVLRLTQETPDPRPILQYISGATLDLAQPARPPNPRTFVWSDQAKVWFESLLWGYVYISETRLNVGAVGVWTGTHVKLFRVQEDSSSQGTIFKIGGGAVEAVGNSLAERLSGALGVKSPTAPSPS
ncbi:high-temperature-induced dauer-formation protein-domain-containing protein [Protomyces lactucae-debilis]|uniref:High-temperature-induced dauer-formation protein-domain-containing protein n=1 Tax=Protomyces lactucae-debilis TaxID=2754530 RepID=A0A1Y2FF44_PROLT|nr:high-temperature-induced dauer-formation protein-domain-containing protein [Protomyces lactucae-debilis]ORY82024.1 high-temperature-induced dauer-formation protein-domain-containing protein [Protomyces lactucae-debilis]